MIRLSRTRRWWPIWAVAAAIGLIAASRWLKRETPAVRCAAIEAAIRGRRWPEA
ncbi:MAG TPA: hypothetical protein VGH33_19130 [Isosphaeraceae bacterium]